MADCPLADDCPEFSERISGMGCQHYGDRGGKEWCNQYNQPIDDLKTQPVKSGEEVVIDVVDMHESGAGVGRTEDGFIVMVDGILPEARARVEITRVHSNHARAEEQRSCRWIPTTTKPKRRTRTRTETRARRRKMMQPSTTEPV